MAIVLLLLLLLLLPGTVLLTTANATQMTNDSRVTHLPMFGRFGLRRVPWVAGADGDPEYEFQRGHQAEPRATARTRARARLGGTRGGKGGGLRREIVRPHRVSQPGPTAALQCWAFARGASATYWSQVFRS